MAFKAGFQPADVALDDRFATTIVPVDSAKHLTAVAANHNLSEAVVAAVGTLLAIGTSFDHTPVY